MLGTSSPSILLVFEPKLNKDAQASIQEVAIATLAAALHTVKSCSSQAWTIEPVQSETLLTFMLAPLPGQQIPTSDLWRLTVALHTQPAVLAVTLIF